MGYRPEVEWVGGGIVVRGMPSETLEVVAIPAALLGGM